VAVSSGISTLEWVEALERAGIEHEMVAGDLSVNAFLLSVGKHLHVLADETGHPLQFDVFGKAIPSPPWRRHLLGFFFPLWLLKRALAAQTSAPGDSEQIERRLNAPSRRGLRRIALVSPRLQQHAGLKVIEDDILSDPPPAPRGVHVLRAANILNNAYFEGQTLVKMAVNLRRRLAPGGLFIVCSTNLGGANHGTVFVLTQSGSFEKVAKIGDGSEIEDLILGLPPPEGVEREQPIESVLVSH
jgi:hypothetical protein